MEKRSIDYPKKKKGKKKQFLESVITFDKLFKGMLNPRAIMPRSNLINFRSIDNRLRRFASRVVFRGCLSRNNFRFNYRYAIKNGGEKKREEKKKRRTIEIERETGTNVSFLRAVWRLPNFQSPSSNSATAIRLRPIRGQNFLSLFYLLLLLFFFFILG